MITQVAGPSNIYFIISSLRTRSKSIYILDRGEDNQIHMRIISHSGAEKTQNISNAVRKNIIINIAILVFWKLAQFAGLWLFDPSILFRMLVICNNNWLFGMKSMMLLSDWKGIFSWKLGILWYVRKFVFPQNILWLIFFVRP